MSEIKEGHPGGPNLRSKKEKTLNQGPMILILENFFLKLQL